VLETLTQEQQWGLAYLVQDANQAIVLANAEVEAYNAAVPEGGVQRPTLQLLTVESFLRRKIEALADEAYTKLVKVKEAQALELFRSKSPQEQVCDPPNPASAAGSELTHD
jgi:hypothetical protein